jgi:MFS family permease
LASGKTGAFLLLTVSLNVMSKQPLSHNRDYKILLGGQIVSDFGTSITQLAYPLLFLSLTGSPLQAGISVALTTLPTFLFGLVAGAIIDSLNRKSVMIVCDIVRFAALGSIPLAMYFGDVSLVQLYLTAFLSGTCDVIFSTAEQTAVVHIVKKEEVTKAFGQYEASANSAALVGPALGGTLYQIGRGLPFLVDAISYIISAISLLFVKSDFQQSTDTKKIQLNEVMHGAQWLWQHDVIRTITVARAFGGIVSGGQSLILILLAQRMDVTPAMIGIIFSIGTIGVIAGSLISDRVQKHLGLNRALIISRWAIVLAFSLQIFSPNFILLGLAAALSYGAVAVYGTIATSYRLSLAPDELQGRVNGFHRMLVFGGLSIGGILTGFLTEHLQLDLTIGIYISALIVLALLVTSRLSEYVNVKSKQI